MTERADLPHRPAKPPRRYDEEYFERGVVSGVSCYMNYRWMPELTLRMTHFIIRELGIQEHQRVLDFGCAKGYLVKAFRVLGIDAYGVDVSSYAISQVPTDVVPFCREISGCADPGCFERHYDWVIAKDVFEHIPEADLRLVLTAGLSYASNMFVAVPLAADDYVNRFIIPAYDNDLTHIVMKSSKWWHNLFAECGWHVARFDHQFKGVKENWTSAWPEGNGFYILTSRVGLGENPSLPDDNLR